MAPSIDELVALRKAGLTSPQINRLCLMRWLLCRNGHAGNPLMTPDTLRHRRYP